MSQPGIKRWHVVFLRDMDGNDLGKQFAKSMEKGATKAEFIAIIPTITDRKFNRMRPSMARVLGLETRSAKAG